MATRVCPNTEPTIPVSLTDTTPVASRRNRRTSVKHSCERCNVRFGPTCAVAHKITNGLVAQNATLASAGRDRPNFAEDSRLGNLREDRAIERLQVLRLAQAGQSLNFLRRAHSAFIEILYGDLNCLHREWGHIIFATRTIDAKSVGPSIGQANQTQRIRAT